ncbi:MAG: plasmid mobilization relaxosome protein MobC [Rikenellaceae bacterium]
MKSRFIGLRLNETEFQRLGAISRKSGKNKSEIIRELLLNGEVKERIKKEHIVLIRQLASETKDLNQLARKANTFGYPAVAEECKTMASSISQIIKSIKR